MKPKHDDFAAFVPFRFDDAFSAGELDVLALGLGVHLARRCYEARNASDGWATVRLSDLAVRFGVTAGTIGRRLRELEAKDWIECEVRPGGRAWKVRLTGLASPPQARSRSRSTSARKEAAVRRLTSAQTSAEVLDRDEPSIPPEPQPERTSGRLDGLKQPPHEPRHAGEDGEDTRPDPTPPHPTEDRALEGNVKPREVGEPIATDAEQAELPDMNAPESGSGGEEEKFDRFWDDSKRPSRGSTWEPNS